MTWALDLAVPGGHRYFRHERHGRVAVADDSGALPEDTTDGVLYLDRGRPIVQDEDDEHLWYVPVVRARDPDDRTSTPAAWYEVVVVAYVYHLTVQDVPLLQTINDLRPKKEEYDGP